MHATPHAFDRFRTASPARASITAHAPRTCGTLTVTSGGGDRDGADQPEPVVPLWAIGGAAAFGIFFVLATS